ncbi:hypothetical protein CGRA01v4_07647 [Colletotrichum graminicola]|uniref:Uncharacterized protein n=1 Tax=Colletotrichum graminicola (strain M1.001 / M2 / FGSC 10212) TaxID=645133 RepID=E3QYK9_COLGM|nr:uncharacterized protein GLRG_10826 [Colletotrichum graminicola M1.001]EFQ35947.1 hypothetical protein GLRG_10826 [Colletotrichum graminicola M1.001]WDK16364.1 hypothetical protein CGRA01v4_07647 [Colletotrichum graminicola]
MLSHKRIYTTISVVGLILLWGIMYTNGGLQAMSNTAISGVFPDNSTLQTKHVGIFPLDLQLNILIAFFASVSKLHGVDAGPYIMLLDLTTALLAINMAVLVESRRRSGIWLRSPALWQYAWNCGGVAAFLPIWCLLYVTQRDTKVAVPMPPADSHTFPLTALLSILLEAPLLLPAWMGWSSTNIQMGVVHFFCGPPIFSGFQALVSQIVALTHNQRSMASSKSGIRTAYFITGSITGVVHLGSILFILVSSPPGLSLSRVYFPHSNLIQIGEPNILVEAAFQFLQYDYIIMNATILVLGTHLIRTKPGNLFTTVTRKPGSLVTFYGLTALLGPGASMAYAMSCEEDFSDVSGTKK